MVEPNPPCPVCRVPVYYSKDHGNWREVICDRCTSFSITHSAEMFLAGGAGSPGQVSGYLRQQHEATDEPTQLDYDDLQNILAKGYPPFEERVERYLTHFSVGLRQLNERRNTRTDALIAAAYCGSVEELNAILDYLQQEQLLRIPQTQDQGQLTAAGHIACDKLRQKRTASTQGFVAMWFNPDLEEAWTAGIEPAIRDAGYTPLRIDKKEHINDITDEIIAEIRASRFVVADLTGQRGGVYYEAGFGYGLEKPVFYTCKAGEEEKVHFDVRQLSCIFWADAADLRKRLRVRIEAVIGAGPKKVGT